jgi:monoterpene epsilon-lactone hydrolase
MPSVTATVIQWLLRTTGTYKKMFSGGPGFAEIQAQALSVPSAPSEKNRKACAISFSEFQGRAVWTFDPKDGAAKGTMLYWHGGGYVYPASEAHWDYLAYLASTHGIRSVAPLYPLAPMDEVGAITGFALDFYRNFVAAQAGAPFTMGGDSAGGGLTAATVMGARDAGLALPARILLICPWLEANPNHPDQPGIEPKDAILTIRGIKEAAEMYAGAAGLADPRVSPIHGDWSGLPPILSFGGGADILLPDARALKAKLPAVDYVEGAGLMHDWPIFFFPESRAAQKRMAAFISG